MVMQVRAFERYIPLKLLSAQAFVYGLTDRLMDARLIAISAEPCRLGDKILLGLDA